MPRSFRRGHDDSIACSHRDVSCCDDCMKAHVEIVNVEGAAYWIEDPKERNELLLELKGFESDGLNNAKRHSSRHPFISSWRHGYDSMSID